MTKRSGVYPRLSVDAGGGSAVSQAGGVLLTATVRVAGLDVALSEALSPPLRPTRAPAPRRRAPFTALALTGLERLATLAPP